MKIVRWTVLVVCVVLGSALAFSQCQDQACKFGTSCYSCEAGVGQGCRVDNCDSCTNSRCSTGGGGGGGVGGIVCQKLPDSLSAVKDARLDSQTGSTSQPAGSTVFIMLSDKGAPAELISFNIRKDSILRKVILLNTGKKEIVSYQLGWIAVRPGQSPRVSIGPNYQIQGLAAEARMEIAEHPFPEAFFEKADGTRKVGFFVASVVFSDGSTWKADLERLGGSISPAEKAGDNKQKT